MTTNRRDDRLTAAAIGPGLLILPVSAGVRRSLLFDRRRRPLMLVHLLRSHHYVYERLLAEARPPTTFAWAGPDDEPDLTIYIVRPTPEPEIIAPTRAPRLRDLGRLYLYSQADDGWFWGPGVFTAASTACAGEIVGGFYVHPNQHTPGCTGPLIEATRHREPDLLWSFVGAIRTAPALRGALLELDDPRADARASVLPRGMDATQRLGKQAEYADILTRSKFVVCPRGFCPTSHRLFETMRAGRVPVVLSDAWRPPPLVDWDTCVIRIPESAVKQVPAILREREADARQRGEQARAVWESRFSPQGMVHHWVESCLTIHDGRPRMGRRAELAVRSLSDVGAKRRVGAIIKPRVAELRERYVGRG